MTGDTAEAASVSAPETGGDVLTLRRVLAAAPDLALGGAFLVAWISPFALGRTAVPYFLLTMLLEFIIVHSSAFMGTVALAEASRSEKARSLVGLGVLYSLFAGGFALAFRTWWPFVSFWGLTLNRLLGVLLGDAPKGSEQRYVRAGWALSALLYLGCLFGTTLLPVPRLGITSTVLSELELPGEGLWIDQPWRVLAFGFLYFTLTGVGELLGWARKEGFLKGVPVPDPSGTSS